MTGYLVLLILGVLFLFVSLMFVNKVQKKYWKYLKELVLLGIVLFIIGSGNLGLYLVSHNFKTMEDVNQVQADIALLEEGIYQEKLKIDDLQLLEVSLSEAEITYYTEKFTYLNDEVQKRDEELNLLQNTYDTTYQEYYTLYQETSHFIEGVITYNQYPNYPNGCESVALYILLQYYQVEVSVEEIVEALPKGSSPYYKNGVLYGGNPEREFVGDPRLYTGYGVFEGPIIEVANRFKEGIINYTGHSLDEILELVKDDHPVQVWVSINLEDTEVCVSWLDEVTEENIDWICDLHSLVIIGYDYKSIITSDPYTGEIEIYDRQQFEKMYLLFGKRAIYYEG